MSSTSRARTSRCPRSAATIARFEDELIDGRGFQLISGLPVERYSDADASAIYWGIGMHLGKPWPQNKHGHLLGDVTDQGRYASDPTARGNELGPGRHAVPLRRLGPGRPHVPAQGQVRRPQHGRQCGARAQRDGAHAPRPRGAALPADDLRLPRRGAARARADLRDAGVHALPQIGCSCATSGRTSSRRGATRACRRSAPASARRSICSIGCAAIQTSMSTWICSPETCSSSITITCCTRARRSTIDPEPGRKRFLKRLWLETRKLTDRPVAVPARRARPRRGGRASAPRRPDRYGRRPGGHAATSTRLAASWPSIGSRMKNVVPLPSSVSNVEPAVVLVDDHRARDREALAGAAADLLGREERIEDVVADVLGDAGAGVGDRDHDVVAVAMRPDADPALGGRCLRRRRRSRGRR